MHYFSWKNIILLCGSVLFLVALSLFGYSIDNNELENKEYFSDCEYTLSAWIFTINAGCIQQKRLPQLTLVDIINETRDQIEWFSGYYEPESTSFNYYGAKPIFKTKWSPYLQWDIESNLLISEAIKQRKKINFTYRELAKYYEQHLSYFVAYKNLDYLWKCTRINYLLALEWMDGIILNPWNIFNVNKKLSSLNWYCEWLSEWNYSFYGGVCGMVSQLFRVSLLNPDIIIKKRFPHNERFVQYYWETIWGDDAAVYEYSKQFEIENLWNSDIVFKTHYEWNKSIFVAISWPTNEWVNISKENIDWKETTIRLNKTVYKSDKVIREEVFDSYYSRKTYEIR